MKRLLILLSLIGASACRPENDHASQLQSFASNLSDSSGKLAQTFLYLIDGQNAVQRECQVALPRGPQDCPRLRSTKPLNDFRKAVQADLDLSRTRLNQALDSLNRDRGTLQNRKQELNDRIAQLKAQIGGGGNPNSPTISSGNVAELQQALKFAIAQREQIQKQLNATRDPNMQAELRRVLAAFDSEIANLQAKIAAAGGSGGGDTSALQQQLREAEAQLRQVESDLNALNGKIQNAQNQLNVVQEEQRILEATLDKLRQSVIFDARDSANINGAEKQLVSRFHKLFTVNTPDCTPPSIQDFKELAVGEAAVFSSNHAQSGGAWHFGEQMRQLMGGNPSPQDAENFVRAWMQHWSNEVRIGGDQAAPRPDFNTVFDSWKQASLNRGVNGIDLRIAPFRLIGITNRLDLRNPLLSGDAGEARLVYALLDRPTDRPQDSDVNARSFSTILEYRVNVGQDSELPRYAQLWHELGSLNCSAGNCQAYVDRLAALTRMVTHRAPGFVKASLGQLRTNEIAFGNPWELREFQLQGNRLVQVDVKKTPRQNLDNSFDLQNFVAGLSLDAIKGNRYEIPANMRGARAHVRGASPEWRMGGDQDKARAFNLNTCNGCHSSDEAVIDGFYHISPFQGLGRSNMSSFLKDKDLPLRSKNLASFLVPAQCQPGTAADAGLLRDARRMIAQPVH